MIDRRSWQIAFLKQAQSDWEAYQRTRQAAWPHCHRLHFLQMATEKLGKALLLGGHSKLAHITHSHSAFVKFMHIASNNQSLQAQLKITKSQLRADFKRLLPLAYEIEHLAPALAHDGPTRNILGWISPVKFLSPSIISFRSPILCNRIKASNC